MDKGVLGEGCLVDDSELSASRSPSKESEDTSVSKAACSYCSVNDPMSLAMCKACSRWFCNGKHGTNASHIILHLVKANHREISLHNENLLSDLPLKCYVCQSGNVFSLGYMPSKEDSVVILVCRDPCLHNKVIRDQNWDSSTWLPLIEERQLMEWLCATPNILGKKITTEYIQLLEEKFKVKNSTENEGGETIKEPLKSVPLRFESGQQYIEIFEPLITTEMEVDKERKKQCVYENVPMQFKKRVGRKYMCVLKLPPFETTTVNIGDIAILSLEGGSSLSGPISAINQSTSGGEEVVVVIGGEDGKRSQSVIDEFLSATKVHLKIKFNPVPYKRMVKALQLMECGSRRLSNYLYFTLLGLAKKAKTRFREVIIDLPSKLVFDLNSSQQHAVRSALKNPLTLIQGPPGTGKTSTSVAIVYHLYHGHDSQILVCAPSNVAADHLALRISETGLKVVRLNSKSRQSPSREIQSLSLQGQVDSYIESGNESNDLKKLHLLLKKTGVLKGKGFSAYRAGYEKVEYLFLSNADVICCTCVAAADFRLQKMRFKYVLVDEATQGKEPETLIPLVKGAKQVILVGDQCQLGPLVFSKEARKAHFGQSMFERLLRLGHKPLLLDVQYRMHPSISLFPSNYFYVGILQNGVTAEQRDSSEFFPWPDTSKPMFFYNTTRPEELGANGTSYLNRGEAALAEQIVSLLIQNAVNPSEIGVITPYASQRVYLKNYFLRCGSLQASEYKRVEVCSVDGFQGREKDFIIFSCVRSNDQQDIGFVHDRRRLNVSLTRAKRGFIILGNARLLSRCKSWHAYLTYLSSHSLIVEGPIRKLELSKVILQEPHEQEETDGNTADTPVVASTRGVMPLEFQSSSIF